MRDAADQVVYVGKAKNLRQRLASYRVANPDRLPRRHLRLLRAVARIEVEECEDERAALRREAELLRSLRPRFNRAGTLPATPRFLAWRIGGGTLEISLPTQSIPGWEVHGPFNSGAIWLRAALLRLLWRIAHRPLPWTQLPLGWSRGCVGEPAVLTFPAEVDAGWLSERLRATVSGDAASLTAAVRECVGEQTHLVERVMLEEDLEFVEDFARRLVAAA
jgi:predicted GIY-YIG superfamily endonuclease